MSSVIGLKAGDLDTPIKIYERQEAGPKVGVVKPTWVEVATANVAVNPVKYLKAALYKAISIEASSELVMRRKDWLTVAHRIELDGKLYTITDVTTDKKEGSTTVLIKYTDKADK